MPADAQTDTRQLMLDPGLVHQSNVACGAGMTEANVYLGLMKTRWRCRHVNDPSGCSLPFPLFRPYAALHQLGEFPAAGPPPGGSPTLCVDRPASSLNTSRLDGPSAICRHGRVAGAIACNDSRAWFGTNLNPC